MKTKIIYAFLSCMLLLAAACEDEVNNWPVDGSQDGLFRSLTFEEKKVMPTSIEIGYTKVVNATDYIFELQYVVSEHNPDGYYQGGYSDTVCRIDYSDENRISYDF